MPARETPSEIGALLRFHAGVGARLAMRVLAPVLVSAVGAGILLGVDFQATVAGVLFGRGAGGGSGFAIFLICLGSASVAAPRIGRGLDGWLRHLPVPGAAHRRAAALAATVAQIPVLLLLLYLSFGAFRGVSPWLADLAGVGLAALAAALFATPSQRPLPAKALALAAGLVAGTGGPLLAGGAVLLVAADFAAGSLPEPRRTSRRRGGSSGRWIEARIAWRALGWKLASAFAMSALGLGAAGLFVVNNRLSPAHVALAARLGGGVAVVFLFTQVGETLAAFRPAWPWSRSLPWPASRRVIFDAGFLAAHAVPLIALTAWIDPLSALPVAAAVPFLAVRTAGALRRAPERRTGASGEILLEGLPAAAAIALLPWVALPLLAAAPWAVRAAAERERAQKVSRWLELHHLAAGDPQSWSS